MKKLLLRTTLEGKKISLRKPWDSWPKECTTGEWCEKKNLALRLNPDQREGRHVETRKREGGDRKDFTVTRAR